VCGLQAPLSTFWHSNCPLMRCVSLQRQQITLPPRPSCPPSGYPTQLTLPDDRVLHVGGYASEADPPVPAIEIWDGRVKRVTTIYPEPFLLQLGTRADRRPAGHQAASA
jgi:hypothetical protein